MRRKQSARNNEILLLYTSGWSLGDCGKKYGVSRERIRQILVANGCIKRHHSGHYRQEARVRKAEREAPLEARRKARKERWAKVREMYDAGITYSRIAEAMGTTMANIQRILKLTGGFSRRKWTTLEERKEITKRYLHGERVEEIAAAYGITEGGVRNIAKRMQEKGKEHREQTGWWLAKATDRVDR